MSDWNEQDALTASVASNATTLTVADGTIYGGGWLVQIDTEALYVTTKGSGTSVTVRRGVRGTTAASHASGATVIIRPAWLDVEILDALNAGIDATFPLLYREVVDTSITTTSGTYEYTIPNLADGVTPIPYISDIDFKENGDLAYRYIRDFDIKRGSSPIIKFRRYLSPGNLRIHGFGPLNQLSSLTDTLDTLFPAHAVSLLPQFAAQYLLQTGEARRVRQDVGPRDERENSTPPGAGLNASNQIMQRFQMRLMQAAMPPLKKVVKTAI